jgi:hypothetical protein
MQMITANAGLVFQKYQREHAFANDQFKMQLNGLKNAKHFKSLEIMEDQTISLSRTICTFQTRQKMMLMRHKRQTQKLLMRRTLA